MGNKTGGNFPGSKMGNWQGVFVKELFKICFNKSSWYKPAANSTVNFNFLKNIYEAL